MKSHLRQLKVSPNLSQHCDSAQALDQIYCDKALCMYVHVLGEVCQMKLDSFLLVGVTFPLSCGLSRATFAFLMLLSYSGQVQLYFQQSGEEQKHAYNSRYSQQYRHTHQLKSDTYLS